MKEKMIYAKQVNHYEGLGIKEGFSCFLKLTNYNLQFCDARRKPILSIALKDISNVAIITDTELIEKDKSVIGRGIVGNVLFGGAGLVLGGLSGLQKKQKKQDIDYLIVNYKSNGEDKVISVYANSGIISNSFMYSLNNAIDKSKQDLKCPNCGKEVNFADIKCSNCGKILTDVKGNFKKVGIAFLIVFVVFALIIGFVMSSSDGNSKEVNNIINTINVEKEQAESINDILKQVGINNFKEINADSEGLDGFEGEGSKGYRIKTSFSDNVILYLDSNNNVICIRYADKDYYRNGQVLDKFN